MPAPFPTAKPAAGARPSRLHPHAVGLRHAFLLNERSGRMIKDSVSGCRGFFRNGTPTWVPTAFGGGVNFPGSADIGNFDGVLAGTAGGTAAGPYAIIAGLRVNSSSGFGTIWGNGADGLYTSSGVYVNFNSANGVKAIELNTPAIVGCSASYALPCYVMTNGVMDTFVASPGPVPTLDSSSNIGGHGSEFFNGDISFIYVYDRYITPAMMVAIQADPFAMFRDAETSLTLYMAGAIQFAATGTGDITIGPPTLDGAGSVAAPSITGTGAITIGPPAIAGAGASAVPAYTGTGAITIGRPSIDGVGGSFGGDAIATQTVVEAFGAKSSTVFASQNVIEVFGIRIAPPPNPDPFGATPAAVDPTPDDSMCGSLVPLFYCEVQTDAGMRSYSWTDQPINEALIQRQPKIVAIEGLSWTLSDFSGRAVITGGSVSLVDFDGSLRAMLNAGTFKRKQIDFFLIDDEGRRLGDVPFQCGQSLLYDYTTQGMIVTLLFEDRLGGESAKSLLAKPLPFRRFDSAFNATLPTVLAGKGQPLPYGILSDLTYGFPTVQVTYSGTRTMPDGNDWYEGYIAGCATWGPNSAWGADGSVDASGNLRQVRLPPTTFDTDIAMPNYGALWASWFGTQKYLVYNSARHTVMYLRVGSVVGEAFKAFAEGKGVGPLPTGSEPYGAVPLHVNIGGIDETGDGQDRVVTSVPRQLQHLITNFVEQNHNTDADWYPIPTTANPVPYSIIDAASVEAVKTRSAVRIAGGYEGATVVGHDLARGTFGDWLQRFALGGDFDYFVDRHGRISLSMEEPRKAAVKAFTVRNILKGTYRNWNDGSKLVNAIQVMTFRNWMQTNESCTLRPSSPPQPSDWLTAPRPSDDGTSIADHGGEPTGRVEFQYEDWVTRDVLLLIPDNVAAHKQERQKNGIEWHKFETDLCGMDVQPGNVFTVLHDEGLRPASTRSVRCTAVKLNPPDPHSRTWWVNLLGYDVTDFPDV